MLNWINNLRKYIPRQSKSIKKNAIPIIKLLLDKKYNYHFDWMGVPTIQFPSDLIVIKKLFSNINLM